MAMPPWSHKPRTERCESSNLSPATILRSSVRVVRSTSAKGVTAVQICPRPQFDIKGYGS